MVGKIVYLWEHLLEMDIDDIEPAADRLYGTPAAG